MTLVDADMGEVVQQCTPEAARALTDKIRLAAEGTWELIKQAYESRAWASLGYSSWDDYLTREFGTTRLRLPREKRQEVVASLRDSGLSVRAIAVATGEGVGTVHRALPGVPNGTPGDNQVVDSPPPDENTTKKGAGDDGPDSEGDAGLYTGDGAHSHDVGRTEPEPAPTRPAGNGHRPEPRIRGTDGKSYGQTRKAMEAKNEAANEKAAELLGEQEQAKLKAERLQARFATAHHQYISGMLALSPEHVAAVIDEGTWQLVEETHRSADEWFSRLFAARNEPFTVIKGGQS